MPQCHWLFATNAKKISSHTQLIHNVKSVQSSSVIDDKKDGKLSFLTAAFFDGG